MSSRDSNDLKPLEVLKRPMNLPQTENDAFVMKPTNFLPIQPEKYHSLPHKLIYSNFRNETVQDDKLKFDGHFESGNLGPVYNICERTYEIHLISDPNNQKTTQWFFFHVSNFDPGEYTFILVGFYRSCNLHWKGSQICAFSERDKRWSRFGDNTVYFQWSNSKPLQWALFLKFKVLYDDSMYFSHLYPYTFTCLTSFLQNLSPLCVSYPLCKSFGGVELPSIFWDADLQQCINISTILDSSENTSKPIKSIETLEMFDEAFISLLRRWNKRLTSHSTGIKKPKKPFCIIAARIHPGETNSSFAMEALLKKLFSDEKDSVELRQSFSFFIVPMFNVDGVICGFYRPGLSGDDLNRVWMSPDSTLHPEAFSFFKAIEILSQERAPLFFLDFHGHTAASNSFVYGFGNETDPNLYSCEKNFPLLMAKHCPIFSASMCSFLKQKFYDGTIRVSLRRHFHIPFSYTLEMSYGGSDFGERTNVQFVQEDYRSIGRATLSALHELLLENSFSVREVFENCTPPESFFDVKSEKPLIAGIEVSTHVQQNHPQFFNFSDNDIKEDAPEKVILRLNQIFRDDPPASTDDPTKIKMPLKPPFEK